LKYRLSHPTKQEAAGGGLRVPVNSLLRKIASVCGVEVMGNSHNKESARKKNLC
jgi:hypothetical protein